MDDKKQENYDAFIDGFAAGTGLDTAHAAEQWGGYSRQLSDDDLEQLQAGGFDAGLAMADDFMEMFPNDDEEAGCCSFADTTGAT